MEVQAIGASECARFGKHISLKICQREAMPRRHAHFGIPGYSPLSGFERGLVITGACGIGATE